VKTLEYLRADIARRLAQTWARELAGPPLLLAKGTQDEAAAGVSWPHAFPIGQPPSADLATRFSDVFRYVGALRQWAAEHNLALIERTRRVSGTNQELPTHVVVPDLDTAAVVAGGPWPLRLVRGRQRAAVLATQCPDLPDRARTLAAVDDLSDVDFDLACHAGQWFATHDATGLTPRQVPIAGMHAKWLNTRHALIRDLAGVDDLKLAPPHPARLHFTYLDPEHRRAGRRVHDSATVGDAPAMAYRPSVVIISENKDTALHFPELSGAISVEGVGRGGATAAAFEWLVTAPLVVYWGDMDVAGLEILDEFRAAGVPARSILMDVAAYDAWSRFGTNLDPKGQPLTSRSPRDVRRLTPSERALYELLTASECAGPRRVEQERIPLAVAAEQVCALVDRVLALPG
jgi:hypothetical protein